jgi:NADH:ubiquinone oxidoreductase subunit F (NADH-binding)
MVCSPRALVDEVGRAGLRGHGGAGFPAGQKLAAVASRRGPKVVVANGTEGEPASNKDKVLLAMAPHLVLDGAAIAAEAVGATEVFLCVDRSARRTSQAVTAAVVERRRAGIDKVAIQVAEAPARYLSGEESALVRWLGGGEAKPTVTPPLPYERGYEGRPTLTNNVETLAHVALIARHGAGWFRGLGTSADPGTTLVTVGGGVARPGVFEVPLGAALRDIIGHAGGSIEHSDAVLFGGYFGSWVPATQAIGAQLGVEHLRGIGTSIGAGVIVVLPPESCGLAETARVTRWLANQSARQCGPCFNGLPAIAQAVETLVTGDRNGQAEKQLRRWLAMIEGRGACRHPDGTIRFVSSALSVFADEIREHRRRGTCKRAGGPPVLPTPRPGGWR